ncbi:Putative serine protease 29 [Pteropus alecto]|uniref:Putative serine protease 29 n=1 Tax=Pteropus alecto TaxID=9402 RepID=L5KGY5_PTEAL|nr:Putative serine protease 29 [Pteropus alecto]
MRCWGPQCSSPLGEWLWQVSPRVYIYHWASWVHIYGDSLIHAEWVLSAVHCIFQVTIVTLLTMVLMQVVEKEVCDQQYASRYLYGNRRITQNNILCAGSEGQDSCSGMEHPTPRPGSSPNRSPERSQAIGKQAFLTQDLPQTQ